MARGLKNENNDFDHINTCILHCNIHHFSDCCRFINVTYNDNSAQVFKKSPLHQVYEMQHQLLNDKPYYIGTTDETRAIIFDNCGKWAFQAASQRSVLV